MRKLEYRIPPDYDGRKLVHFLRGEAGCSAALVSRLKQYPDGILLDGIHARTIDRLRAGALLTLTLREDAPAPENAAGLAANAQEVQTGGTGIDIACAPVLYEDEDLIAFYKPTDMSSHPSKRHQTDTLATVFAAHCAANGVCLPWRVLTRLDRNTTGVVLAAKNAFAANALTGKVDKVYLAVVQGCLAQTAGEIDAPIGRPDAYDIRRAVMPNGQRAVTEYRVLKTVGVDAVQFSVVRCTLPTGRTHQIRVHMAHIGCPLAGDDLYGGSCEFAARQLLHCAKIAFMHPVTGVCTTVVAPLPKDMQKFVHKAVENEQNV